MSFHVFCFFWKRECYFELKCYSRKCLMLFDLHMFRQPWKDFRLFQVIRKQPFDRLTSRFYHESFFEFRHHYKWLMHCKCNLFILIKGAYWESCQICDGSFLRKWEYAMPTVKEKKILGLTNKKLLFSFSCREAPIWTQNYVYKSRWK